MRAMFTPFIALAAMVLGQANVITPVALPTQAVPDTLFSIRTQSPLQEDSDAQDKVTKEEREFFSEQRTYRFLTDEGVVGVVLVFRPSLPYQDEVGAWAKEASDGIAQAAQADDMKITKNEKRAFGKHSAYFVQFHFDEVTEKIETSTLVIAGEREIVVLVMSYDRESGKARNGAATLMNSVRYDGAPMSVTAQDPILR